MPEKLNAGTKIEHVVVLMLENRSYDNVLGRLYAASNAPPYDSSTGTGQSDLNGLTGTETNPDPDGGQPIAALNQASQTIGSDPHTPKQRYPGTAIPILDPGETFGCMAEQFLGGPSIYTTPPYPPHPTAPPAKPLVPPMQGFTLNYSNVLSAGSADALNNVQDVMNYLTPAQLPVTSFLANRFAVCDDWFASVPSQTYVNRIFALCASPAIVKKGSDPSYSVVNDQDHPVDLIALKPLSAMVALPSVCEQLDRVRGTKQVNWKLYFHDYSIASMNIPYIANAAADGHNENVSTFDSSDWGTNVPGQLARVPSTFVDDVTAGATANPPTCRLPAFSFIEPRYSRTYATNELPPNSNHPGGGNYLTSSKKQLLDPPIDATGGELLLMQIYNLLRSNPACWESTLLIISYDEHGGVFDHQPPPPSVPPGAVNNGTMPVPPAQESKSLIERSCDPSVAGFGYTLLGGRVPAIIVSPAVARTSTIRAYPQSFDHTSIVKTVWDLFGLSCGPNGLPSLTRRDAAAPSLVPYLTETNDTAHFVGTIVASPSFLIFSTGLHSQMLLASAGPGCELSAAVSAPLAEDMISIPAKNMKYQLSITVAAGTPQTNTFAFTVGVKDVHPFEHATPGTYTGSVTISGTNIVTGDAITAVEVPVTFYVDPNSDS
jgi:phospholipase C